MAIVNAVPAQTMFGTNALRDMRVAKDTCRGKGCRWSCMGDVAKRSFIEWRDAQTDYEARTLNNYRDAAGAFFNWVDRSYEISNPLARIGDLPVLVKYPQGPRAFTEEELEKLFVVAKPKRRVLYRLLAFSGLRRREAQRLCWGDVHLDEAIPGLFLRPEATKARRADWLPILSVLAVELRAARPDNWKPDMLLFPRGVSDVDTLHRDMVKAGIPLKDRLGRPAGIHTFRRTFISHLQKRAVHSRVIMQLARHKSLRMTDWTYTDATQLPLAEGIESLASMAAPRSSPRNSGQNGVSVSKAVQEEKSDEKESDPETLEGEDSCHALAHAVQTSPCLDLVPGVGLEPTLPYGKSILSALRIPFRHPGQTPSRVSKTSTETSKSSCPIPASEQVDKNFFSATVSCSFAARARLSAGDFKSDAYANSATRARFGIAETGLRNEVGRVAREFPSPVSRSGRRGGAGLRA